MSDLVEQLMGIQEDLSNEDDRNALGYAIHEIERLRSQLVCAKTALERIEKSDRFWGSPYAKNPSDILDRATSGNVLVHGHEGRIARDALAALIDDQRSEK